MLTTRRRWIVAAALALIVAAEQPHRRPAFNKVAVTDRVRGIASRVPAGGAAFLLVADGPRWDKYLHDDAAWAALAAGVPTVNGRYGHFPPGYPFRKPRIRGPQGRVEIRHALDAWMREGGVDPATAEIVEVAPRPAR